MGNHSAKLEEPETGLWGAGRAPSPLRPSPTAARLAGARGKVNFPGRESPLWNALMGL